MRHPVLKVSTTTDIPLELALWHAYEEELEERLASSLEWQQGDADYTSSFNTSFNILLNNKGMIVLRDMLRAIERMSLRHGAAVINLMLEDALKDKLEELQLDQEKQDELIIETSQLLEELFEDRNRHLYDKLCTIAITSHLYFSGYEFYNRETATQVLDRNDPQTAGDVIMMLAASGRRNAGTLLLNNAYDPVDPRDLNDISTTNIISAINFRLASYLANSAALNYELSLLEADIEPAEVQPHLTEQSQPITSFAPQEPEPATRQLSTESTELPSTITLPVPQSQPLHVVTPETPETLPVLTPPTQETLELAELRIKAQDLETKLKEKEALLSAARDQLKLETKAARQQKYLNSILNQKLAQKEALRSTENPPAHDGGHHGDTTTHQRYLQEPAPTNGKLQDLLNQVVASKLTPAESLKTIEHLLGNNVTILPTAYKSAKESEHFKDRKGCFKLLWRLATEYRAALLTGHGDTEARKVFTYNEYASNDGEAGERNKAQRRFAYKGEPKDFEKHLRLGIKKSPAETLRIYFDFDPIDKKIVIAYCGPHL